MPRTDAASRVIAATPERVYAALVDPEALAAWLPPDGMSAKIERFDLRPGGSYRMVLTYADAFASLSKGKASADSDIVEARFIDIVPGARVVQAVDFISDDPAYAGTMTMTGGDGLRISPRQRDSVRPRARISWHVLGVQTMMALSNRTAAAASGSAVRYTSRTDSCLLTGPHGG